MKSARRWRILSLVLSSVFLAACADLSTSENGASTLQSKMDVGHYYRTTGDQITFSFPESAFRDQFGGTVRSVEVAGTFTQWKIGEPGFQLAKGHSGWRLTRRIPDPLAPGASGRAEFKFVVNGSQWLQPPAAVPVGYKFTDSFDGFNFVIIRSGDDPQRVAVAYQSFLDARRTAPGTGLRYANWRAVHAGAIADQRLFRAAHPFSDQARSPLVRAELVDRRIAAIIDVAGDSLDDLSRLSVDTPYIQALLQRGAVVSIPLSGNEVYFRSETDELAAHLGEVARFIGSHPGPWLVHCAEGKDRTGVVVAFLEAFMGASWADIVADYLKSNDAGFTSVVHVNQLSYSLKRLLGVQDLKHADLADLATRYLKNRSHLSDQEIEQLRAALAAR